MRLRELLTSYTLPRSQTARLDLELLAMQVLACSRIFIYTNPTYELTQQELERFIFLYNRRLRGEPMAYIIGKKEFWSLEFTVNTKVLIPRSDTELLVETVLAQFSYQPRLVVDLGTGSGAIAISLARERPEWQLIATDISEDALQVASFNAMQLGVTNIEFYCDHWCKALAHRKFDLILSNPPYVARQDSCWQQQPELRFEPKLALLSGEDGLSAIEEIVTQAQGNLNSGGWLILECGRGQHGEIIKLLERQGYAEITYRKDLNGIPRLVLARA